VIGASLESIRAGFHLATSRVTVVDDYYQPMYAVTPRPGTRYVQVWHAAGAFKRFGYSVLDKEFGKTEEAVARFPIHTNYDVCLVSAMRYAPNYAEAFRQPLDRFDSSIGIPRTDVFFGAARDAAADGVMARYPIAGRRAILYAPTFRGTSTSKARTPVGLDLQRLPFRHSGVGPHPSSGWVDGAIVARCRRNRCPQELTPPPFWCILPTISVSLAKTYLRRCSILSFSGKGSQGS
jgi:CDP-ribitol ribitolphosphotransferase